jgi:XTP/dITP diphosphohydrolase
MKLVLATRNGHKIREMSNILSDMKELELLPAGQLTELPQVEEGGADLRENALLKAYHWLSFAKCLTLAEDTGLEIDALGGNPGVRSARFAGERASYEQNIDKVLALMGQVPPGKRGGRFRSVVAIVEPGGPEYIFEGVCEGRITTERRGRGGFGYDPIFEVSGYGKTFAEMEQDVKDGISHRALALQKAKVLLRELCRREKLSPS